MILYPKGWEEPASPVKPTLDTAAIKAKIKAFVTTPKRYEEIVGKVQADLATEDKFATTDDIVVLIEEVRAEWHPVVVAPAPEPIEEP